VAILSRTCLIFYVCEGELLICRSGLCGGDRMVVGFTTTCASSAYHH